MFPIHQITVDVPDCPTVVPNVAGIPSWVVGWGLGISVVIVLALVAGITIARVTAHEQRTARQASRERALIDGAKLTKNCPSCGFRYSIEDELKKGTTS
jgi:hypothetical protein